MKSHLHNEKGFTLVEILIVVAVVGILAAIAVPSYRYVLDRARRTSSMAALDIVRKDMELYLLDNGSYPLKIKFKNFTDQNGAPILSGNNWQLVKGKIYKWDNYKYKTGTYTLKAQALDSGHTVLTLTPQGVTH